MKTYNIACIPGDGIGKEVIPAGQQVLQALAAMRGLTERALVSPDPAYRAYLDQLGQENCQIFADLHNSTTAAQRGKAVDTLKGYVQDIQILNARKS